MFPLSFSFKKYHFSCFAKPVTALLNHAIDLRGGSPASPCKLTSGRSRPSLNKAQGGHMLREHLKCPVCGEPEIVCELNGYDQVADMPPEPAIDLASFVFDVWGTPPPLELQKQLDRPGRSSYL
jgi:hypothetical protein